jgi:putative zinc finger/helix-turn-helix YgiT family protein
MTGNQGRFKRGFKMNTKDNLVPFPDPEKKFCPDCDGENIQSSVKDETLEYGDGKDAIKLNVSIPVQTCSDCGFMYTDDDADMIRHEAVCRHLGVMTPDEVSSIRKNYGMSRAEFSRVTKIGEASLNRWENGLLIQSAANDRYLYLSSFKENIDRLVSKDYVEKKGYGGIMESKGEPREIRPFTFRSIERTKELERGARTFRIAV